jgi:hypothetical protein
MMRRTGVVLRKDDREQLFTFIDSYMSDSLHTVVERDGILPNVVHRVSIPMTDANWAKYSQLLAIFGFASGMHAMLAVGSDEFDNYTYVVDGTSAMYVKGWKVLASASEKKSRYDNAFIRAGKGLGGYVVEGGVEYAGTIEDSEQ